MTEENVDAGIDLIELTTHIIRAYVSNNPVPAAELPRIIADVHAAVRGLRSDGATPQLVEKLVPAVSVKKSVTPEFIICLEDGKQFKSLKRHLATHFGLTPDEYRTKWGLPADYPMVAPNYSAARSQMARAIGLGRKAAPVPEPVKAAVRAPRKKLGLKFT